MKLSTCPKFGTNDYIQWNQVFRLNCVFHVARILHELTIYFFIREQIMPVLNRAFEHVVPGIIPASVPTISLPDLITPGAASPMPLNRTVPPPNYQVPAHSLRLQNAQGYQQRLRAPLPGQIQVRHIVFCDNLKPPTSRSRWFKEITRDTTPPASLNLSLSRGEAGILDYF